MKKILFFVLFVFVFSQSAMCDGVISIRESGRAVLPYHFFFFEKHYLKNKNEEFLDKVRYFYKSRKDFKNLYSKYSSLVFKEENIKIVSEKYKFLLFKERFLKNLSAEYNSSLFKEKIVQNLSLKNDIFLVEKELAKKLFAKSKDNLIKEFKNEEGIIVEKYIKHKYSYTMLEKAYNSFSDMYMDKNGTVKKNYYSTNTHKIAYKDVPIKEYYRYFKSLNLMKYFKKEIKVADKEFEDLFKEYK